MDTDSANHYAKPVGDSRESGEINHVQVIFTTTKGRLVSTMKNMSKEAIQDDALGSKSTCERSRESNDSVWDETNSQAGLKWQTRTLVYPHHQQHPKETLSSVHCPRTFLIVIS